MANQLAPVSGGNAATKYQPKPTIVDFIKSNHDLIQQSLPRGLDADRFSRLVLTTMRKTPQLQECSPQSFVGSMLTAAALGLEVGLNNEAHLVPFRNRGQLECQLVVGYGGVTKQFWQHPLAAHLDTGVVYAEDEFDFEFGTQPFLKHKPRLGGSKGDPIAFYAVAGLKTGAAEFTVLTPDEVRALRLSEKSNVRDPQHWMSRKTALVQCLKLMPKSTELVSALAVDEQSGGALWEHNAALAINTGSLVAMEPAPVEETAQGDRVVIATGEVVDEPPAEPAPPKEQAPEPDQDGPMIPLVHVTRPPTSKEILALRDALNELGYAKPSDKRAALSKITGRDVGAMGDLTDGEEVVRITAELLDTAAALRGTEPVDKAEPEGLV